jgi:hypothetical protein
MRKPQEVSLRDLSEAWALASEVASLKRYSVMIKARARKGGVRIGKTPKKLASICCP